MFWLFVAEARLGQQNIKHHLITISMYLAGRISGVYLHDVYVATSCVPMHGSRRSMYMYVPRSTITIAMIVYVYIYI